MPQICYMGQTALLPFQRKACWGFFSPWKIQPANLGTKVQHATSRPPKPLSVVVTIRTTNFQSIIPRSDRGIVTSYALYGSQNIQRLFLHTALTDWPLEPRKRVFTARYELNFQIQFRLISVFVTFSKFYESTLNAPLVVGKSPYIRPCTLLFMIRVTCIVWSLTLCSLTNNTAQCCSCIQNTCLHVAVYVIECADIAGYDVLTVVFPKIRVCWEITQCRRMSGSRRFEGTQHLHDRGLTVED